jgi:hypothetical protein
VNDSPRARTSSRGSGGAWLRQLPNQRTRLASASALEPMRRDVPVAAQWNVG